MLPPSASTTRSTLEDDGMLADGYAGNARQRLAIEGGGSWMMLGITAGSCCQSQNGSIVFTQRTSGSSLIVSLWDVSLRDQSAACLTNSSPFQTFRTIMFLFKIWNVSSVIFSTKSPS